MATTQNVSQTYDLENVNREDLLDVITMISPTDTPFFSSVAKGVANATLHEWPTDELAAAGQTPHIEGEPAVFAAHTDRLRLSNFTQIFQNPFAVTTTQERVITAGLQSEVAYQGMKAMKKHKLDIEEAIFNNASPGLGGDATNARFHSPLKDFISGSNVRNVPATPDHILPPTAGADSLLIEADLNLALETTWNEGGDVDVVMCSAKIKRRITGFSENSTRSIEMTQNAERRQINRIDVYEGDFGVVRIVPNRLIPIDTGSGASTDVYFLEMDRWSYDFLTNPFVEPLAKDGDAIKRWVYSEGTLVGKAHKANFVWETVDNDIS